MGILKTVELADFAEKNAKRIRILKTVELADFAEKNAKRRGMECWKNENSNVVVRPSKLKPLQCNVLLLCPSQEKRICEVPLFFRMFLKTIIHETMLSGIFQMFASFKSRRFPKLRISTVFRRAQKNTSKISRKSTENRMTKRMGFYEKRSEVCKVYRFQ